MATNEILPFAETDTGTNLSTQAEYLADVQRTTGNQPGVARSKLVNKALRQASAIAAGVAKYIADRQLTSITDSLTPTQIADAISDMAATFKNIDVRGGGAIDTNAAFGLSALIVNTTGASNTAVGVGALALNTTASSNTAVGKGSLANNTTTGTANTGVGDSTLGNNTSGSNNTAIGAVSMRNNTTGIDNVAVGRDSLYTNTSGSRNSAVGLGSLFANTIGSNNTAFGWHTLLGNTVASDNTAFGYNVLASSIGAIGNTGVGSDALAANTNGSYNIGIGKSALINCTTGSGNIQIGAVNAGGTWAPAFNLTTENRRVIIGATDVTNAYIQVAWTVVSDARDKTDFAPVPHGLAFVNALKPTTYRYKAKRTDTKGHGPLRYGFKAQDVLELEGAESVIVDSDDLDKLRFNDQALIAVLVNAIKELDAKFTAYQIAHP